MEEIRFLFCVHQRSAEHFAKSQCREDVIVELKVKVLGDGDPLEGISKEWVDLWYEIRCGRCVEIPTIEGYRGIKKVAEALHDQKSLQVLRYSCAVERFLELPWPSPEGRYYIGKAQALALKEDHLHQAISSRLEKFTMGELEAERDRDLEDVLQRLDCKLLGKGPTLRSYNEWKTLTAGEEFALAFDAGVSNVLCVWAHKTGIHTEKSRALLERAEKHGSQLATMMRARYFLEGKEQERVYRGVVRDVKEDDDPSVQVWAAVRLWRGDCGVQKNRGEAEVRFERLCQRDRHAATVYFALLVEAERFYFAEEKMEAYLKETASSDVQALLGELHVRGCCQNSDLDKGIELLREAAETRPRAKLWFGWALCQHKKSSKTGMQILRALSEGEGEYHRMAHEMVKNGKQPKGVIRRKAGAFKKLRLVRKKR